MSEKPARETKNHSFEWCFECRETYSQYIYFRFAVFFATFLVAFFATFFTTFLVAFFAVFFATFFTTFFATFFATFFFAGMIENLNFTH